MGEKPKDIKTILAEAMEKSTTEERSAYLDDVCGGDSRLRQEVESLLQIEDKVGDFLEVPPFDPNVILDNPTLVEGPGTVIGKYKLLEKIGEGGMAVVYMAEQKKPLQRKVALKIIKLGMDTKQVIARFEAERQALAMMDHPNISKVLDAGATETGRPYFVMELVRGVSLTEYCDENKVSTQGRLDLFIEVCNAVQHAHQKGIIHRDIKPSNVMVTLHDDKPVPKVIDFGIAKATSQKLTEKTLFTRYAQLIGTPEYMSPEQAQMSGLDIDTRTDIYSLGVLLYELLTGALPFDPESLRSAAFGEIQRIIREEEPPTPSKRLSDLGDKAKQVAQSRSTDVITLVKRLQQELEWVPLMAMRKDRTRRYRSVSELADDIQNYLNGNPLIAGPPSVTYRVRKFIQRNRKFVTGFAAVAVTVLAGFIVSTSMYFHAEDSRREAERQAKISTAVNDFFNKDLLMSVVPSKAKGREVTVREVLDAASEKIEAKFKDEPVIEASIRETLGRTYRRLGEIKSAEPHLERAFAIHKEELGEQHPETLYAMSNLAVLYIDQDRYEEAERLFSVALKNLRIVAGEEDRSTISCTNNLATVYSKLGRHAEAEALYNRVLEVSRRVLGAEHLETLAAMNNLASLYEKQGQHKKAEELYVKTLEITRKSLGREHPQTLSTMYNLAKLYQDQNLYDKAEQLYNKALEMSQKVLGEDHPDTVECINNLAVLFFKQGQYKKAEPLFVKTLDIRRRTLGEEDLATLQSMNNLAELHRCLNQYEEAEKLFVVALEVGRRVLGEENSTMLQTVNGLAAVYNSQKRYKEAEPLLLELLKIQRRVKGEQHLDMVQTANDLGSLYYLQERYEQAQPLLVKTLEGLRRILGQDHPSTLMAMHNLAQLYTERQRYNEAEPLYTKTLEVGRGALGNDHPFMLMVMYNFGVMYTRQVRYDEAEKLLVTTAEASGRVLGAQHRSTVGAINKLIELYELRGKPQEAEKWRIKLSLKQEENNR
ncbi:MAG: tetratricopeptide repeat protein [Planctomycetota bacterium]|jgi:serine/threonine protein kinase/Tfp pilus assembly protein PilF